MDAATLLLTLLLLVLPFVFLLSSFIRLLIRQHFSPLRLLSGPPSPSFFMGNLAEMHDQENNDLVAHWEHCYGSTFVYRGFVGGCRLMTTDPIAVGYILGQAYSYPKPDFVRDSLATMAAGHHGLLVVEGADHRRQRKIIAPAFSASQLKSLTPVFWQKAVQLRDIWLALSSQPPQRIDALSWLSRATLDAIGLAGFGYSFNALTSDSDELANAFSAIFSTARKFRVMTILQVWFPILRRFRRNSESMKAAHATMRRIGLQLVEERQEHVLNSCHEKSSDHIEGDKTILGRDLLTILIRSNHSEIPSLRMSTEEILSQLSTFIAAGHETSASGLSWCFYALAQNPRVQRKLREELRALDIECPCPHSADPTFSEGGEPHLCDISSDPAYQTRLDEALSRCTYLEWVVREALRVHAPVTSTMRVCMKERDEIPVSGSYSRPFAPQVEEGGYVDRYGQRRYTVQVKKHDIITIPIQAINKSKKVWGEDAAAFKPERWADPPDSVRMIPGLYANTLTFLNGNGNMVNGNRSCIGYKFALSEIKIFLYVILRDLEIWMDPATVIEKKVNVVTRPFVKSEPELGNQMPIYIRRAKSAS